MVPSFLRLPAASLALVLAACTTAGPDRADPPAEPATAAATHAMAASEAPQADAPAQAPHRRHDPRLRASMPRPPAVPSPVAVGLDAQGLAALDRHAVTARVHDSPLQCEGVALYDALRASDAVPEGALRGPHLARYVLVDARDGYRVVFSLAELDPGTGNRAVYLVDRCDGDALTAEDGPLRLLVPDDVRAARSVRQVEAITVVVAP